MALALPAIAFAALVTRVRLGFGFSVLFVPVATFAVGFRDAFHCSIVLEVVVGAMLAYEHRERLRMLEATWLKLASLAGLGTGLAARAVVSIHVAVITAMAAVVVSCAAQLARPPRRVPGSRRLLSAAGVASGILNSWTSMSGPPVVLYYLMTEDDEDRVHGSLAGYFILLYAATLAALIVTGSYGSFDRWALLAAAIAVVVAGRTLARRLAGLIPGRLVQTSLWFLIAAALVMLVREVART